MMQLRFSINPVKILRFHVSQFPSCDAFPQRIITSRFKAYTREYLSTLSNALDLERMSLQRKTSEFQRLKNSKKEFSLLILGGGPSARIIEAEQLIHFQENSGQVMMLNDVALLENSKKFVPNYYLIVDPDYWKTELGEIENFKRSKLRNFLIKNQGITIIQPARFPKFSEVNPTLFINPTFVAGFKSRINPVGLWGHTNTVSLYSLAIGRYFGYKSMYFAGLDSSAYRHFKVDELNNVYLDMNSSHAYSEVVRLNFSSQATLKNEFELNPAQRTIQNVLYAEVRYRKSFSFIGKDAVNVGGDTYNDLCNRACLVKKVNVNDDFH